MSATAYEVGLLASLLTRPELASALSIAESDFSTPVGAGVFTVLKSTMSPTPVSVTEELARLGVPVDTNLLSKLFALKPDGVDQEEVEQYAAEVREDAVRRRFEQRVARALELCRSGQMEDATASLSRALLQVTEETIVGADPTAQGVLARMATGEGVAEYFPSGLDFIDSATGGLRAGHIWVIAARYKGRKTTTALHIVKTALDHGRSVAYIALEDDDVSFVQRLMGLAANCPSDWFEVPQDRRTQNMQWKVEAGLSWMHDKKFRVYDAKHSVHTFSNIPNIVRSDKIRFDTDLLVVDYLQAWTEDYEKLTEISNRLQKMAQENGIAVLELSQFSGETIKAGSQKNYLATKGTQALGAACHVGLELRYDPMRQGRDTTVQAITDPKQLGSISEIGVNLKVARKAPPMWQYLIIEPTSGTVVEQLPYPTFPSKAGEFD